MARALDETHSRMVELATVQRYPFPITADGRPIRDDLRLDVNTGDGALMAVEAVAALSGLEFSNSFAIAQKGTSPTKTA